jgi:hypothetical protein
MRAVRIVSVDIGIRHMAWFTGTVQVRAQQDASEPLSIPLRFVHSVLPAYQWELADIVPSAAGIENVNAVRVEDLVPWLLASFLETKARMLYVEGQPVQHVLLEQQPLGTGEAAARNIKTKVLSHILQACILRELPGVVITFVSPRKKLRHAAVVLGRAPETYADNKRAAKLLAPVMLRQLACEAGALDLERRKGKKDDLADALLQGVYAIEDWAEESYKLAKKELKSQEPTRAAQTKKPAAKRAKKVHAEAATAAASASLLGPLPSSSSASSASSASSSSASSSTSSSTSSSSASSSSASSSTSSSASSASAVPSVCSSVAGKVVSTELSTTPSGV